MKHSFIARICLLSFCALPIANALGAGAQTCIIDGVTWKYTSSGNNATIGLGKDANDIAIANSTVSGAITIPDKVVNKSGTVYIVTNIANYAFNNCTDIKSIVIPSSVKSIGLYTFWNCTSMTNIVLSSELESVGSYAFQNCNSLTKMVLPQGVKSIGLYAFNDCTSLTDIVLPDGIESIGSYAFQNCTSIIDMILPQSIQSIGTYAFHDCKNITDIVLPVNIESIATRTFQGCTSLKHVTIPNGVTSIGSRAFLDCSSLASIYLPPSVVGVGSSVFKDCNGDLSIYAPAALQGNSNFTSYNVTYYGVEGAAVIANERPEVVGFRPISDGRVEIVFRVKLDSGSADTFDVSKAGALLSNTIEGFSGGATTDGMTTDISVADDEEANWVRVTLTTTFPPDSADLHLYKAKVDF